MEENNHSQNNLSSNEDGPFIGKKSLKAMLEQSEDILRKNGGPTFLKRQEVIEVKTGANESDLIKVQQIHALKDLINTIPGQMQRHEEKIQDLMQEVHLVLASMKAQQQYSTKLLPPTKSSNLFGSKVARVTAVSVLVLVFSVASFSLGKKWNKSTPLATNLEPAQTSNEFSLRPRTNLRLAPSLEANIIIMTKQSSKAIGIQSKGEWTQVLVNQPSGKDNVVGWVHKSNLLPAPTNL